MIPQVFHRIWIGSNPRPAEHLAWQQDWERLHPEWEHTLWGDAEIEEELPPNLEAFYRRANSFAGKSDLARYWIVSKHGGVYLDCDRSCLRPIDALLVGIDGFLAYANPKRLVTNNIFGFMPGHAFLRDVLAKIPDKFKPDVGNSVGPNLFTEVVRGRSDVHVFEQRIFCPVTWEDQTPLKRGDEFPESYSVHYFDATWVKPA